MVYFGDSSLNEPIKAAGLAGAVLEIQEAALKAAGCDVIRSEKRSGTTTAGRAELQTVLEFLRPGDTLMVTRIDRLARSIGDLANIVNTVKAKGASLKATEQPFDTGSIYGELTVNLLGCFAQFETAIRKERQLEGIAHAAAVEEVGGKEGEVQFPFSGSVAVRCISKLNVIDLIKESV